MKVPTILQAALALAERGWPVFPCNPLDKRPLTKHGFKDASKDPKQINAWWGGRQWPLAMIGVPMGPASGVFCVDLDRKPDGEDGVATWAKLESEHGVVSTRTHGTPSTGQHKIFRHQDGLRNIPLDKLAPGLEVKADGGYAIVPPSRMADGKEYTIIDDIEPAPAPSWLLEMIQRLYDFDEQLDKDAQAAAAGASANELPDLELIKAALDAIPSDSYDDWYRIAGALRRELGDHGWPLFKAWSQKSEKFNDEECRKKWDDAADISRIKAGTIFYEASKRDSHWRAHHAAKHGSIGQIALWDFRAYLPHHNYMYLPTRELWPAASINACVPPVKIGTKTNGTPIMIKAGVFLDNNCHIEQMTWAPGLPMFIEDRHIFEGGWIDRKSANVFNLYRAPKIALGDASKAGPWLDHVRKLYGGDSDHIVKWMAQRVQHPGEKICHALVLGSQNQGIGKDTLLEPVKRAIGQWNFAEVTPQQLMGRFNGFLKSVILRVNEARDLGDISRFQFYDHMKAYTASPPDVLRVDEKNLREHSIINCLGVILTTNYKTNGIYLPAEDRRHFVAWSDCKLEDFSKDYFSRLWRWYETENGYGHVAAYLTELDISSFNAKAPPLKTQAFWDIVESYRAGEDAELQDVLDQLGNPIVVTLKQVAGAASWDFQQWLTNRKNRKQLPHRFENCGYEKVTNENAKDGLWKILGERQVVYGRKDVDLRTKLAAAAKLTPTKDLFGK